VTVSPVLRAAVLTVVLATAACGAQDGGSASGPSTATSAGAAATATATASGGPSETSMPKGTTTLPKATGGTAKPTAPNTSQLRKNLSAPQRRYVARNADPGIDAEAILQSGEDACQRMSIAAAASGTTAVAVALVSGQIKNGREAIRYLCPSLKPALSKAEGGFPDGTYVVGTKLRAGHEVPAGRYAVPQPPPGCVWSVTRADGTVVAESKAGSLTGATLKRSQRLTSTGCGAWLRS